MKHEADHGQGDHALGDLGQSLVVLGQATPPSKPAERPFDHLPARVHDEAGDARDAADDDQLQAGKQASNAARRL